jgi:DNA-binding transcriptional LysR family regulator
MKLGIRQLEVFRIFARTHSVTETARALNVSQPAVSQTLKEMEGQFGFPLSVRFGSRTRLTDEARALLPDIERLLAQISSLKGRAEELRDSRAGSLAIASVPTLFADLLPKALASFLREYEKVELQAECHVAAEVLRQIRQDMADIGFAFLPVDEVGVAVQPLMKMAVVCVVPAGHRLATRSRITPDDLLTETVIIQGAHTPPGFVLRDRLERDLSRLRIINTNQSTAALNMARQGVGIALVHPLTLSGADARRGVVVINFEPRIELVLGLIYARQKPVSRLVLHFERHFRAVIVNFCAEAKATGIECEMMI